MIDTATRCDTDIEQLMDIKPCCEAIFDLQAHRRCQEQAVVIVRYKAHGCRRDGKGILLGPECLSFVASGDAQCAECNEPLFIVSTVAL